MTTLLDIRTMARIKSDQTNSTFPTDAEYNLLINEAAREVFNDMLGAGLDVTPVSVNTTTAANPSTYSFTVDVASVTAVYFVQGGQLYELRRMNPGLEAQLRSYPGQGFPEFYKLTTDFTGTGYQKLEVLPASACTLRIDYIPQYTAMANDAALWLGPSGSDELLAWKAAAAGLRKEGSDRDAYECEKAYERRFEKVMLQVSRIDGRNAAQIRDARGTQRPGFEYQAMGPGWDY